MVSRVPPTPTPPPIPLVHTPTHAVASRGACVACCHTSLPPLPRTRLHTSSLSVARVCLVLPPPLPAPDPPIPAHAHTPWLHVFRERLCVCVPARHPACTHTHARRRFPWLALLVCCLACRVRVLCYAVIRCVVCGWGIDRKVLAVWGRSWTVQARRTDSLWALIVKNTFVGALTASVFWQEGSVQPGVFCFCPCLFVVRLCVVRVCGPRVRGAHVCVSSRDMSGLRLVCAYSCMCWYAFRLEARLCLHAWCVC